MRKLTTLIILALLTVISARGEGADSLQVLLQRGDSCMQRYNTFEALSYYRQFLSLAEQEPANEQLDEMIEKARAFILYTTLIRLCCRSFSFNAMSASVGAPMRSLIPIRS